MLSKTATRLLKEIAAKYGEKEERQVEEDPEACLVSLLEAIKERLPKVSAMLDFTIEVGMYTSNVEEARESLELERAKK